MNQPAAARVTLDESAARAMLGSTACAGLLLPDWGHPEAVAVAQRLVRVCHAGGALAYPAGLRSVDIAPGERDSASPGPGYRWAAEFTSGERYLGWWRGADSLGDYRPAADGALALLREAASHVNHIIAVRAEIPPGAVWDHDPGQPGA